MDRPPGTEEDGVFDAAVDYAASLMGSENEGEVADALLAHRIYGMWLRTGGDLSSVLAEARARLRDLDVGDLD